MARAWSCPQDYKQALLWPVPRLRLDVTSVSIFCVYFSSLSFYRLGLFLFLQGMLVSFCFGSSPDVTAVVEFLLLWSPQDTRPLHPEDSEEMNDDSFLGCFLVGLLFPNISKPNS